MKLEPACRRGGVDALIESDEGNAERLQFIEKQYQVPQVAPKPVSRQHGLRRCRYYGADGTARWVGLGVIADDLVSGDLLERAGSRIAKSMK